MIMTRKRNGIPKSGQVFSLVLALFFSVSLEAVAAGAQVKVVASIAPLADFARQVGGDRVAVTLLLPPGASPHTYEPTPKTMQSVSQAQIFLKIGAGLEFWTDRLIRAAAGKIAVIDASEGIRLLKDDGHGGLHGTDPHYWLDPVNCLSVIHTIETAFASVDPANAGLYRRNAAAYRDRLLALDREISERVRGFRTREYVTFHAAWNYFSKRYGLSVAGVIEEGPGKEPSPRHIQRILRELKRFPVKVVFAEPQFSPKIAEAIAREAGGKVLMLDPIGGEKGRETYLDMMRYNLAVMEGVMK